MFFDCRLEGRFKTPDPFSATSPYGRTAGKSTAAGLCQVTRSSYDRYAKIVEQLRKQFGANWDEELLNEPMKGVLIGLFILQGDQVVQGKPLGELLRYYKEGPKRGAAGGPAYARKILQAAELLRTKDLSKMTEEECKRLKEQLDTIVR